MSIFKSKVHTVDGGSATVQQVDETIKVIHLTDGTEVQFSTNIFRKLDEERWQFDSAARNSRIIRKKIIT